jgi:hypothetical protein
MYVQAIQSAPFAGQTKQQLIRELNFLRSELDDVRTKYAAVLADITAIRTSFNTAMTKLNADAGVTDADYAAAAALTATALAAAQFNANT